MRKTNFDSKIIIYRSRQIVLLIGTFMLIAIFMFLITANMQNNFPWFIVAPPIIGTGLLILIVPKTEEWEYKPWQGRARQVEQQER